MSETTDFWRGDFGDEYLKRCRVDWMKRVRFWHEILAKTGATKFYEIGCNAGWNLLALRFLRPDGEFYGIDANKSACTEASNLGFSITNAPAIRADFYAQAQIVFTAGVLIHIPSDDLKEVMKSIIRASEKYVLAIEYYAPEETEVEYRGHSGKLWKRAYGKLYQGMGLTLVESGDGGEGFDNCTYWLLRK